MVTVRDVVGQSSAGYSLFMVPMVSVLTAQTLHHRVHSRVGIKEISSGVKNSRSYDGAELLQYFFYKLLIYVTISSTLTNFFPLFCKIFQVITSGHKVNAL